MHFTVRAPASSANLGPGFDALALALDLWNELEIDTDHASGIEISGSDAALLADRENYSLLAMRELAEQVGRTLPPFFMRATVEIPVSRGLGSSAAALACGLYAANTLLDLGLSTTDLFQRAWQMEGHGDNVGAAIYGGAVLAVSGLSAAIRLTDGESLGLKAVVFIPAATGATWAARAALPPTVPLPDAAYNVGTAASLSIGLLTNDRAAIAAGMQDRLHEPYRARLFPHLTPMTDRARAAGAIGACLSGAGPTILALADPDRVEAVQRAMELTASEHHVEGHVAVLDPSPIGASLTHLRD